MKWVSQRRRVRALKQTWSPDDRRPDPATEFASTCAVSSSKQNRQCSIDTRRRCLATGVEGYGSTTRRGMNFSLIAIGRASRPSSSTTRLAADFGGHQMFQTMFFSKSWLSTSSNQVCMAECIDSVFYRQGCCSVVRTNFPGRLVRGVENSPMQHDCVSVKILFTRRQ